MKVPFSPPEITESDIEAVTQVLRSGWITTGKEAKTFELELSDWMDGAKVAVLNSATAGMELVLRLLGVGEGDEVITSVYTYAATVNVIRHVGATPVLVDVEANGYNLDINAVERAITSKTKVIIPVDIGGYPCDYDALYAIVERKKEIFTGFSRSRLFAKDGDRIVILADAAHSFGASYYSRMSGNLADFSAFSFHAVKNLTTGEGGALSFKALFGRDVDEIYQEVMLWSLHGQNKDALAKTAGNGWEYDILFSGYKWNMPDIMAALGRSQLQRYDQILAKRRNIYSFYRNNLIESGISIPNWDEQVEYVSSFHLTLAQLPVRNEAERNDLMKKLAENGIICNVHFKPLVLMSAFQDLNYTIEHFPNARQRYQGVMSLPIFNTMNEEQMVYVVTKLQENCKNKA